MKKKRNIFRVCVCLLLLFLAGGCGTVKKECSDLDTRQNDAEPVTIRFAWWGEQERAEKTKEALELFMEKNPDILVQAVSFPYETYHENMEIFIETGYMPDVWQGYVGSKNEYMDAGLVEALDTYVSSGLISVDDISEHLLETGKIDGKLYGLSLGCNVKCMVVIPEYFRKAGIRIPEYGYESWEALETDLLMIKEGCDIPVAGNVFNRDFTFEYFCQQRGERKFKNADVPIIGFSKKTYVDYYEMWMRWEEAGLVPAYMENYMDRSQPVSEEDKPLYVVNILYSNSFEQMVQKSGKKMELIPLPGMEDMGGMEIRPGSHICMSTTSEHKDASARLIDFLINDVEANQILNADRGMPASGTVREAILHNFNEAQQVMAGMIQFAEEHSIFMGPVITCDTSEADNGVSGGLMEELEQKIMLRQMKPQEAYDILAERFGAK